MWNYKLSPAKKVKHDFATDDFGAKTIFSEWWIEKYSLIVSKKEVVFCFWKILSVNARVILQGFASLFYQGRGSSPSGSGNDKSLHIT